MENIVIRKALVSDVPTMDYLNHIGKESDNLTFGEEGIGYTVEDEVNVIQGLEENLNSTMVSQ